MPIDQKILDEINSSLTAAPAVTGPNSIPSVNPDNLGRSLKLVRTKGGNPLVEAEDTEALDMAERQAAWERLVSSAPRTAEHMARNPLAAAVADNDWEPVGAIEKSLFVLGEAARIPYQAGTGITGSLYGILGAATEVGNTLASSAQRTAADLFSRLFLPPARQGQGKPTLDSLAGPMSPESDVSRFFRSASAGVAKLGRDYGTASGNYGGDIGRMVAGGAASAYQNAMMLGFAGTIAPAVAGTRMAVAAPMAPMGLVTTGGEYAKARDAGLSVGQSLAYAGSQGGIDMATGALPFGILVDDIKASMPIAKIIGKQLLAENLEEQIATHAQDFNEWINLHSDKTIGEYLKERPNAALETAVQTTVATLLLSGPGSIAMRATYLDMQRADEAMAQKRADALTALNTAAAASKTLQRDRQTFEEIVAAQTKEGPVTDVYIDAQVLNQSGLADQVVADSPSAAEQYQAALETGGQVRIPVSEYAARIAPQAYAQELVEDVRFDPLDMTLREAKDFAQSGAMQELEQTMVRIIGDKAQTDTFTASRDRVKQQVLDNLNALGRFTPQKNELDATLIAARSATRAAQLGITPEQFFNDYLLKVTAEGVGGQVLNQFAGQGALTADLDALKVAQDRVAAGEDAEAVRRDTGWHTGADGKWRFEISDADARLTPAIKSLGRGGYDSADIQEVTYRKNDDGTYSVALMHAGAKDSSGFVNLDSVPEEVVRAILPDDVFAAVQRGDGEADFIGANLDDAKTIKMPFRFDGMNALPLDMVIDHPALFSAYPALRQVMVKVDPKAGIGGSLAEMGDGTFVITVGAGQQQSTMLHEIQHAIQSYEGFAGGGSPNGDIAAYEKQINDELKGMLAKSPALEAAYNKWSKMLVDVELGRDFDPAEVDQAEADLMAIKDGDKVIDRHFSLDGLSYNDSAPSVMRDRYKRLAGEVEARNTQARASMSDAERRATSPQSTADVADRDQIVTFAKGLAQMVSDKPTDADLAEAQRQLNEQLAIADRMIAERGGLFAPNGEKSKLSRYQWAQVRTANFKRWFGDWEGDPAKASKVVDDNGEPLVVYHSTLDDKVKFNKSGQFMGYTGVSGISVTDNPEMASRYLDRFGSFRYDGKAFEKNVMPLYVRAENPLERDEPFKTNLPLGAPLPEGYVSVVEKMGHDALIRNDAISRKGPVKHSDAKNAIKGREIVVFDPNQIKSAIGNAGTFSGGTGDILNQIKRGSFSPSSNTIALLKNADLSTFLHESGHYFLETDIAIAGQILRENGAFGIDTMTPGQQQILRDVSALLKWHGIEGDIASQIDQWDRMDFEERRAYHEKTAESFERYLMEGKAPSIELQPMFQAFRQWLLSVYKSLKDFLSRNPDAGELNPEVRAVFDRMLATEEEIKLAEQARGMLPLFADAMNAGMTPAEFAEYQKLGDEATQAAIDQLQAQGIRDMKWLNNARSRMLKQLQRQAKAQRAEMRAIARMDVLSEPVYQAWNILTSKMTAEDKLAGKQKRSESVDPAVDSLFEAIAKLGGLNKGLLVMQWGVDPKDKAESGLFGKPVLRAKDAGRSLDAMVEVLTEEGYLTPDENGKGDIAELEERFKAELRGDRQYSSIRNWEPEQLAGQGQDLSGISAARIDRDSLDMMEDMPQEAIDRLELLGMTARSGGIHPDVLSEILPGWTSGDELVRALADARPMKEEIEARTDQLMLEQYSDLATPEAIQRAADAAVHNDARERFLAAEHKALVKASGDKTQKQLLLSAAKEYARQLIGRQRIRDIRPSQYTAAEARAAKAAATSKDMAQKATEKRNQILSSMAAREAYRAQDDVNKALRYLKKFDSPTIRKRVNGDYVDQIEAMLEKVDLRKRSLKDIDRRKSFGAFVRSQIEKGVVPAMSDSLLPPGLRAAYQAKVMERDENGELIVRDDVEQAKVLADYLDMAETRSYKDMTVEEFRGLVETIRQIEHLGRKKKSLLTARDGATYEQKRDELVASVTVNSERLPDRMNRTIPNDRAEKLRGLRDFRISLRKIGMIMRLLDGNKDGGPMWDFFVRSANERGDWETEQIANSSEVLTKALRPVFTLKGGMRGKGIHFESIGRSLNREQRIGLALNVGNEGNLQRLLDGEGWTYADIQPVLESLTAAEWQAVQDVWDHMDSYRPMIAAIEKRTVGGEPEWVQPMQFTVRTKDGQTLTLKGGYYPVKYDTEASQRAEELEDATDAKRAMNAATNTSTTHRSFVKKRSEAVYGRPLELSLSAMYSGVQDVIHDLAWREWLIDASKMISSSTLDDAIRRKYGAETPRAIRQWISDIAAGTRKPRGVFDRAAAFIRKNVAASGLALNIMNAVQNVTGLNNSIERIGAKWLAVGQGEYLSGRKEAAQWVYEKSSFMANRARTQFRDLNELRNVVENGDNLLTKAKNNQFILITVTQKMVDTPTWIGAYRKAEAEGAVVQLEDGSIDDSKAVAMADQAVIDSQGSGMTKDLAGIERGGELAKLFTAYYSYMNTTYNLAANRIAGARGGSPRQRGAAALHLLVLMAVPVAIMAALKAGLTPGDDDDFDDPEKLAKKLAMEQVSFAMGLIPMAREFTPMIQPFLQDQTFGYQGPAGLRIIGDATKFSQQAAQGEFDDGFRKAAVGLSGSLFGLPAAQINRTWTGVEAIADDKTDNPGALLFGYQGK